MNKQLMEILNVIHDGLRGEDKEDIFISSADDICSKVILKLECGTDKDYGLCYECPVGYRNSNGYATQIIQVFKNI